METIFFHEKTPMTKALLKLIGDKLSYAETCVEKAHVSITFNLSYCEIEIQGNKYSLESTWIDRKVHPAFKDLDLS